ncbi:dihydrolipoyl dehydrogenase family protein [Terribacillus saccharophilus]|uniref:dihydrolipoyl dehydrogenase family protein n=1 Tax=Terribacillus saccharophilus TaxID=361277 RepID=UPI002DCC58FC|nr:NAD(P)/FAD-dependent oxidoreductase [Terribacillus saccharophilus]MEC0289943.1 NAD(P)/FAD-dependent oxidoreductase [Terribacillus saccharophilus]
MHKLDLIVIGSGVSGHSTASAARNKGWTVAVIDDKPFGGTCPQWGCDPKKVLIETVKIQDAFDRMKGYGLTGDAQLDWSKLREHKETFTKPIPESTVEEFKNDGIEVYQGHAQFIDDHTIEVNGEKLQASYFLIASGASPTKLPVDGSENLVSSDAFFELDELPQEMVLIGGGYISFEFAHIAARLNRKVTIIHRGERPLEGFDEDVVNHLVDYSKKLGIDIRTKTELEAVEKQGNAFTVSIRSENNTEQLSADIVIHGAGRAPNVHNMELDRTSISYSKKGIKVDKNQQSISAPHIYAAGDCADDGKLPLTPLATEAGSRVIQHMLEEKQQDDFNHVQPSVVYTIPGIASVGVSADDAANSQDKYTVIKQDLSSFFTNKTTRLEEGYSKIILDKEKQIIVGAHLYAAHAEHLINVFTLAIEMEAPVKMLQSLLWAYPTAESDIPSMLQ